MRTKGKDRKTKFLIVLQVHTFFNAFLGGMSNFYEYKIDKLRQILHTGP